MVRRKINTGITIDKDLQETFYENPYLKRCQFINDAIREKMISQGMLKQ